LTVEAAEKIVPMATKERLIAALYRDFGIPRLAAVMGMVLRLRRQGVTGVTREGPLYLPNPEQQLEEFLKTSSIRNKAS
jgi:hypothetical protein